MGKLAALFEWLIVYLGSIEKNYVNAAKVQFLSGDVICNRKCCTFIQCGSTFLITRAQAYKSEYLL